MTDFIQLNGITIGENIFKIGNKSIFLISGEIHYFRIKREFWEDRLNKAKEMGLNTISTYIPWIFHEPEEEQFDFYNDEKDLDHFLHICENRGLYILIKPGPTINGGIKYGGLPEWLINEHPKVLALDENFNVSKKTQSDNPTICYNSQTYLKYAENYINKLGEIISRHLYPHGGVILVQPDDEISYNSHQGLFDIDYNPMFTEFYTGFLQEKYKKIAVLNKIYNTQFLDFFSMQPPNSSSFQSAADSMNEFQLNGEFLRILDWIEAREYAIQDYTRQICYFFRKSGIFIPYIVNVNNPCSPFNSTLQQNAYKTKLLVGGNIKIQNASFGLDEVAKMEFFTEILKDQVHHLPIASEFWTGSYDQIVDPSFIHIKSRMAIGNGIKGLNYYMVAGGMNPSIHQNRKEENITAMKNTVGYNGENYFIDESGTSCDFNAPISTNGERTKSFYILQTFLKFLNLNSEKLVNAKKIYDDISYLFYYPYSRINFDTKRLRMPIDYTKIITKCYSSDLDIPQSFFKLNIHPKYCDISNTSLESLKKQKIAFIPYCNFLDSDSMRKIRSFIEEGGIVVSIGDIPHQNEKFLRDNTLLEIYKAAIQSEDNSNDVVLLGEPIANIPCICSYKFFDESSKMMNQDSYKPELIAESDIIAYREENNKKSILGFHRRVGLGHIYHLGFLFTPDDLVSQKFCEFLIYIGYSNNRIESSKPITAIHLEANNSESFITVANITEENIDNVDLFIKDVPNHLAPLDKFQISNISIPAKSALIWNLNTELKDVGSIDICTSEINNIQSLYRETPKIRKIEGFHFLGSRNFLRLILKRNVKSIFLDDKDINDLHLSSENPQYVKCFSYNPSTDIEDIIIECYYSGTLNLKINIGQNDTIAESINISFQEISRF